MSYGSLFGLAVPYGEPGRPSGAGSRPDETVFVRGAFDDGGIEGGHIWLNVDHQRRWPLGSAGGSRPALRLQYGEAGIYAAVDLDRVGDGEIAELLHEAAGRHNIRGFSIEWDGSVERATTCAVAGLHRRVIYDAQLMGVAVMVTQDPAYVGTWCWRTGPAADARFTRENAHGRSDIFIQRW
jgi:hypothetical protein